MEGNTFLWLCWLVWLIATFFLKINHRMRYPIAMFALLCIILFPYQIHFVGYTVTINFVLFLCMLYFYIAKKSFQETILLAFYSLIVCISYATFILFEHLDPVLFIFGRNWMVANLMAVLAWYLHSSTSLRMLLVLSGMVHGEVMITFIFKQIGLPYVMGAFLFLDTVARTMMLLFGWALIEKGIAFFNQHFIPLEKGRRKQI